MDRPEPHELVARLRAEVASDPDAFVRKRLPLAARRLLRALREREEVRRG